MKEKGIILGTGFLGTRISNELGYPSFGRVDINPLNLDNLCAFLDKENPDILINAIGKTGRPNIDWCEENKEVTIQSNVVAATNICTECSKRKIYFIHLGSGCIYKGDNNGQGYSEKDEPNFYGPQFYSKTKILAEKILAEFPGLILRIRMPIDDRPHERNLIDKLSKYSGVIDVKNSMTTVPHMIETIKKLVDKRAEGIYNLVNPGAISPKEIMEMYRKIINPLHKFEVISLKGLDSITKGKRSNCFLSSKKLEEENIYMPEIHDAVRFCLLKYGGFKK